MKVCATSKIQVAWDDCDQNAVSWSWKRGNLEVLMGEVAYCPDDGELHGEFDHIVSIDYNQETASPEVLRIKFKDSDPVWEEDSDQWRKMNADNAFLMNCLETFMQTDTVLQTLKAEIADRRCLHQDKPKRSEHAETKRKVMECAAAGDDSTLKELIGHQMEQSMHRPPVCTKEEKLQKALKKNIPKNVNEKLRAYKKSASKLAKEISKKTTAAMASLKKKSTAQLQEYADQEGYIVPDIVRFNASKTKLQSCISDAHAEKHFSADLANLANIRKSIADLEATASKFPDSKKRKRGATAPEGDGSVDDNNSHDSDNSSD